MSLINRYSKGQNYSHILYLWIVFLIPQQGFGKIIQKYMCQKGVLLGFLIRYISRDMSEISHRYTSIFEWDTYG